MIMFIDCFRIRLNAARNLLVTVCGSLEERSQSFQDFRNLLTYNNIQLTSLDFVLVDNKWRLVAIFDALRNNLQSRSKLAQVTHPHLDGWRKEKTYKNSIA